MDSFRRDGLTFDVRHQRRAFGANGFYGNSPSKEWTDLTMGAGRYQRAAGAWLTTGQVVLRSHGDHFLWDINRPGFAENRHRTYAIDASATGSRLLGATTLTVGGSAGSDRVESTTADAPWGHLICSPPRRRETSAHYGNA